jgi:hypothetical protein
MKIEGAKYGGNVEHVGSPFEETKKWLETARLRSDFVEVETSYLQEIFNSSNDHLEMYLLISDILGSDTETLANATSGKRKNSQNKLLASIFERDSRLPPVPMKEKTLSTLEIKRKLIYKVLPNKSVAYRYYIFSHFKDSVNLSEEEIIKLAENGPTFTDKYLLDRLVLMGELLQDLQLNYEIAFSKSLVTGTWNPKTDKLQVIFKVNNLSDEKKLQEYLHTHKTFTDKISTFADFKISTHIDSPDLIWMKKPTIIDPDFFVKIYSQAGFQNVGLYHSITYNGNIKLDMLPTKSSEEPLKQFYQGNVSVNHDNSCIEAVNALMTIF